MLTSARGAVNADVSIDQVNVDLVNGPRGPRVSAPHVSLTLEADVWVPHVSQG